MNYKTIMKKYTGLFLLAALFISSCREEVAMTPDPGYSYFPLKKGSWIIYKVDSTYYDDFSKDTFNYTFDLLEKVDTLMWFSDSTLAFRLERYKRPDALSLWNGPRIWWADTSKTRALKAEENNIFVKLIFPNKTGDEWNGNAMNTFGYRTYVIQSKDIPYTIDSLTFDSTLTVVQQADTGKNFLLDYRLYTEKYARNIGLIEKVIYDVTGYTDKDPIPDTISKPILKRIRSGIIYRQRIHSWGF
jgi:hypothetical protein